MHDCNKLATHKIGFVEIIEKINPNACSLQLSSHIQTSDVFNVRHLIPYVGDNSSADKKQCSVEFKVGDFALAVLAKGLYPTHDCNNLAAHKIGSIDIIEKINPNAGNLQLSSQTQTSDVFNIRHLIPYVDDNSADKKCRSIRSVALLSSRMALLCRQY